jgi:hypothetical protein
LNLDNTEKLFLPFGDSPYKDYVNPDTVFFISTSHYIKKTSEYEEVVIGQYFYADDWSFSESSMTASVSMRDHSKYLQEEDAGSYFNQYINAGKACSEIVASNGVPARKISFIDTYRNTIAEDNPFCFMPLNEKSERLSVGGALYSESGDDSNERGYEITGSVGNYRKIDRFYNIGLVDLSDNICTITKTDNYSIGSTLVPSEYLSYQKDTVRSAVEDSTFFSKSIETGSYGGTDVDIALKYIRNYPTDTPFTEVPFSFFDLSDWSLEFHFALNPTYTTVGSSYINLFYENATNGSISIAYKPKSSTKIDFKISLVNTSATTFSIEEVDLDRNSTHLITVVRSSTGSNTLKLYLDGELVGTQTLTGSFSSSGSSSGFAFAANNNCLVSYLSVFKYSLSADQIEKHNLSAKIYLTNVFNALYNFDNTYWDGMLEIATADLGMFYFDEYGVFNYEHRTSLHDANLSRYQVSQYDLSDDVNIISGDQRSEVQANKVTVNISSKSARSSELMSLWRPEEGESLAVTTITSDVSPYSDSIILANADDPYWIPEGYVKIDDEIIRYNYIFGNTISSLERGMFGTAASWHQSGSKARETRVYNAEFTDVPAVDVRYPLIAAEYFDGLAEIDYYTSTPSGAYIIVSATESNDAGDLVILEGNDPISDKRNYFSIAGYAFKETDAAEVYETPTAENEQSIRRYRVKELVISNQFIDSKPYAKILADHILGYYSSPVSILNLSVTGIPQLQLGDLITVTNFASLGITAQKFWVIENNISYDGGLVQDLVLRAYADTITPPSLTIQSRGFVEGNSGIIFYPTGP